MAKKHLILFSIFILLILASCTKAGNVKLEKEQPTFGISVDEFDLSGYAYGKESDWRNTWGHGNRAYSTEATVAYKPELLYKIEVNDRVTGDKLRVLGDKLLVASKDRVYAYKLDNGKKLYETCISHLECMVEDSPIFAYKWDAFWTTPGFYTDEKSNTFIILAPASHGMGDNYIKVFDASNGESIVLKKLLTNAGSIERPIDAEVSNGTFVLLYRDFPNKKYVLVAYQLPEVEELWRKEFKEEDVSSIELRLRLTDSKVIFVPRKSVLKVFDLKTGKVLLDLNKGSEVDFAHPMWKIVGDKMIMTEPNFGMYKRIPVILDLNTGEITEGTSTKGFGTYAADLVSVTPHGSFLSVVGWNKIEGFDVEKEAHFEFGQDELGFDEGYKRSFATKNEYLVFTERDPKDSKPGTSQIVVGVADLNKKKVTYLEKFKATWKDQGADVLESFVIPGGNKIIALAGSDYPVIYVLGDNKKPTIEMKEVSLVNGSIVLEGKVTDDQSKVEKVLLLVKYRSEEGSDIKSQVLESEVSEEGYFRFEFPAVPGEYKVMAAAYDQSNNLGTSKEQGFKIIKV